MQELGRVAARAAFSTTLANTAGQITSAAGAPSELTTALQIVVGIVSSVGYDRAFPSSLPLVRTQVDRGICSTTADHTDITLAAAEDAGFDSEQAQVILKANLGEDLDVLNNESHFDFAAQQSFTEFSNQATEMLTSQSRPIGSFDHGVLETLGKATHHLQDQFALGPHSPGN
jgi:hypothetical protein